MRVVQGAARPVGQVQHVVELQPSPLAQQLGARPALHVLHDDEVPARRLVEAEVEDLHDVRVHEPRGGERLAAEA